MTPAKLIHDLVSSLGLKVRDATFQDSVTQALLRYRKDRLFYTFVILKNSMEVKGWRFEHHGLHRGPQEGCVAQLISNLHDPDSIEKIKNFVL